MYMCQASNTNLPNTYCAIEIRDFIIHTYTILYELFHYPMALHRTCYTQTLGHLQCTLAF